MALVDKNLLPSAASMLRGLSDQCTCIKDAEEWNPCRVCTSIAEDVVGEYLTDLSIRESEADKRECESVIPLSVMDVQVKLPGFHMVLAEYPKPQEWKIATQIDERTAALATTMLNLALEELKPSCPNIPF